MNKGMSLFFIVCLFSVSVQAFEQAKLDRYLDSLEAHEKAMFSLAIIEQGKPVYQKAIGYADAESQLKANQDTQYRIGSISKVFTSTMIFQLIDEGKLALETSLAKFYPKVKNAQAITVSMLLSHRSGIHNFTNMPNYTGYMTQPKSKAAMVDLIEKLDSDFKPGSRASYSNSGYVLLGFIIEDISHDSYANQLQKRISAKLKLNRTEYGGPIRVKDNQAKSYTHNSPTWLPATVTDMSIPHGAGAIISTPTDVATFVYSLLTGKLVSAESLAKMKELNDGFGRGLFQFPFFDRQAFGHTGGIDGFNSITGYFETDDVVFALTANGMNYAMNNINIAILSIYFGRDFALPDFDKKAISIAESDLIKYQGVFASSEMPLKITVKVVDGQLTAQATGQSAFILKPESTTEFRFDAAGIVIVFASEGETLDYTRFQLQQGGKNLTFSKE